MAILTKEDLIARVQERIGDDNSDEAIQFVEDLTDTINSYTQTDGIDWKEKYETNDKEWRKRYTDRFFHSGKDKDDELPDETEEEKPLTFDDLFKEEK